MKRFWCIFVLIFATSAIRAQTPELDSFELVWKTVRDNNPDSKFNGLNWQAVHDSYRPRVAAAQSIDGVRELLREMVSKLGVSHYSVIPGSMYTAQDDSPAPPSALPRDEALPAPEPIAAPAIPPDIPPPTPAAPHESTIDRTTSVQFGNLPEMRVEFESRRLPGGAGYIRFNEFLDPVNMMPRFASALSEFASAPGVILDLRGNRGGIGIMASGIAGFFIGEPGHMLGEMKMRSNTMRFAVFPRAGGYKGRLAILIDGDSASTSEIFAQGLQDLKRARIFGTRSAGATLTSDIIRLPDGDGFQYPNASYTSVGGRVLEGNGVIPDVEVPEGEDVIGAAAKWIATP